jgi:hypothetical protein
LRIEWMANHFHQPVRAQTQERVTARKAMGCRQACAPRPHARAAASVNGQVCVARWVTSHCRHCFPLCRGSSSASSTRKKGKSLPAAHRDPAPSDAARLPQGPAAFYPSL